MRVGEGREEEEDIAEVRRKGKKEGRPQSRLSTFFCLIEEEEKRPMYLRPLFGVEETEATEHSESFRGGDAQRTSGGERRSAGQMKTEGRRRGLKEENLEGEGNVEEPCKMEDAMSMRNSTICLRTQTTYSRAFACRLFHGKLETAKCGTRFIGEQCSESPTINFWVTSFR